MHPVIKIVSFLIFGATISTGSGQMLLVGVSLVLPLYLFGNKIHLYSAFVMLKRLKWLFISILIVYLFFTPGQLLWADKTWSPTYEGLSQGFLRVAVLVLLVAAVNFLISSTRRDDFLSAILWCLRPLSIVGLPHERLAVRITLTIEEVSKIREHHLYENREASEENGANNTVKQKKKLFAIARTADHLFRSVIKTAETTPVREILLPEESAPPVYQWLVPVLLVTLFSVLNYVGLNYYL